MSMRVRYIKDSSLEVMESTVNLLISEGWERDSQLLQCNDEDWLITLVNYDRRPAYGRLENRTASEARELPTSSITATEESSLRRTSAEGIVHHA